MAYWSGAGLGKEGTIETRSKVETISSVREGWTEVSHVCTAQKQGITAQHA